MNRTAEEILKELTEAYAQRDILDIDQARKVDEVTPEDVKKAIADIAAEYQPMHEQVDEKIAALEEEAKAAVLKAGETCKGGAFQAVWNKPRVTWDTKQLDGLMIVIPELQQARKEGKPSVTLRRTG